MLLNQDDNELSTFMLIERTGSIYMLKEIEAYTVYAKERRKSTGNIDNAFPFTRFSGGTFNLLLIQNRKAFSMREGENNVGFF
ncbi:MAG: hypothetical protein ACLS8T_41080 [Anaerobutyricum sp.]